MNEPKNRQKPMRRSRPNHPVACHSDDTTFEKPTNSEHRLFPQNFTANGTSLLLRPYCGYITGHVPHDFQQFRELLQVEQC